MGRVVSYNDGVQRCTFCGKSEHEVHRLVAGAGVAICDECIGLCVQILSEENANCRSPRRFAMCSTNT